MADHIFRNIDRDVLVAIMDRESKPNHIGNDRAIPGPGLNDQFLAGQFHFLDFF
jgi:hypothetical protein